MSVISSGKTGFRAPVTHADVLRAIEEYDRLGQDPFLAEYGFGRATAYLLIYQGQSYDSKAILGVAYKFATGVRIGPHEFSGGVHGAAGVLRRLGFEVRNTRDSAGRQAEREKTGARVAARPVPAPLPTNIAGRPPAAVLDGIDPERSLLVLTCSARKQLGGAPPAGRCHRLAARVEGCPDPRTGYRSRRHARVLPAWRRYTGTFYQNAQPALADAVARGHVVIISGGYGIVRADEPISWYDKVLQLAEWPPGLLSQPLSAKPSAAAHRPSWRSPPPAPITPGCSVGPPGGRQASTPGWSPSPASRRVP